MCINAGGTAGIYFNYSSREYFKYSRDLFFYSGTKLEVESMYRTLYCNDICDKHIGQTVQLAGWVDDFVLKAARENYNALRVLHRLLFTMKA